MRRNSCNNGVKVATDSCLIPVYIVAICFADKSQIMTALMPISSLKRESRPRIHTKADCQNQAPGNTNAIQQMAPTNRKPHDGKKTRYEDKQGSNRQSCGWFRLPSSDEAAR